MIECTFSWNKIIFDPLINKIYMQKLFTYNNFTYNTAVLFDEIHDTRDHLLLILHSCTSCKITMESRDEAATHRHSLLYNPESIDMLFQPVPPTPKVITFGIPFKSLEDIRSKQQVRYLTDHTQQIVAIQCPYCKETTPGVDWQNHLLQHIHTLSERITGKKANFPSFLTEAHPFQNLLMFYRIVREISMNFQLREQSTINEPVFPISIIE